MAKRPLFTRILVLAVLLSSLVLTVQPVQAQVSTFSFPRSGQTGNTLADLNLPQDIPPSYELVGENTNFQLYANPSSLAFKVLDKRSGYVWHSNLDEKIDGDRLNKTWMAFASSGISIDFLNQQAQSERASITNSEPVIAFKQNGQGFEALITFPKPSISFLLRVSLEDDGVKVEVPFDSLKEADPQYKLGVLYLYPFMGYTREDLTPGYMFIPDGSGSLIRFSKTTKAKNMFYGRYYGADLGMLALMPLDMDINRPYSLSVPVYGIVHGEKENAFISVIEDGASYGELQVHPAGIITNFNFIYNAFIYNESYFQATNRAGAGVTTLQKNTNAFDIKVHYRFLTGNDSDYVGMARSYQRYLVDHGDLKKVEDPGNDIGIKLEFLGGEKEKVLFWYRLIPMTTVAQMEDILSRLQIKNPEVVYFGWQPLGAASMPPKTLKLESGLGNINQLKALEQKIHQEGGDFYLYLDPQAALRDEGGYSPRYDLAMAITNVNEMGFYRFKVNYYLNYNAINDRFSKLSQDAFSKLDAGLALDEIGFTLYSDFKNGNFMNREQAIKNYQALMQSSPNRKAFYLPNDYMYPFMSAYFDMPLGDSGYIYTTDSIPFLPIILSGYVPCYGPALNFSSDLKTDLLLHADFGVYPSYFVTQEETGRIMLTSSFWIYSSSYAQWGDEINQTYQWLNHLLGPVKGQSITAREWLKDGVVAVTYANGKQIIVNYTDQPFQVDGTVVGSRDAAIREVTP